MEGSGPPRSSKLFVFEGMASRPPSLAVSLSPASALHRETVSDVTAGGGEMEVAGGGSNTMRLLRFFQEMLEGIGPRREESRADLTRPAGFIQGNFNALRRRSPRPGGPVTVT